MARMMTAQNAIINTASVQIKTLTVAGKQVTLAVFRQLIEEHIFDFETGGLRGVGWGHVRYLIEAPTHRAINLVWQRGDELRRCIVLRQLEGSSWDQKRAEAFLADPIAQVDYWSEAKFRPRSVYAAWGEEYFPNDVPLEFEVPHRYPDTDEQKLENGAARDDYRSQVRDAVAPMVRHAVKIEEAYRRIVTPLFDLPQLFIAV